MQTKRIVAWLLIALCSAGIGVAQEEKEKEEETKAAQSGAAQGEEKAAEPDLAQQARNPTSSLTMLQVLVNHTPSYHNLENADMTSITLMPVIPFKTGKLAHVARITLPYVTNSPDWANPGPEDQGDILPPNYVPTADIDGFGDTALFDLMIFPAPWKGGKIAAGISAMLPTASDPALGTEKWSLGPAFGGLVQSGKFLGGVILLANFSVAGASDRDDVRLLTLQPFASQGLGNGWSVETSMLMFNYDFNSSRWTSLPLGARIGKMTKLGKQPVRFFAEAEYNFADKSVAPEWTIRFAVVPLL